jgi:hypothetical protein
MCWDGAIASSEATSPHKASLAAGMLRIYLLCWWAYALLPTEEPAQTENHPSDNLEGRGKKEASATLLAGSIVRTVRGYLEPWVMLRRYCRAYSAKPPPPQPKALLERVFSGQGLYLYVH